MMTIMVKPRRKPREPMQIRISTEERKQVMQVFEALGLDMSTAVRMFFRQCVLHGGLPFDVAIPDYEDEESEVI